MGRHSAPDDDPDGDSAAGVEGAPDEGRTAVALAPGGRGRHARDDDGADAGPAGGLGVIEDVFAADAPVEDDAPFAPADAITERIPPVRSPSPHPTDAPPALPAGPSEAPTADVAPPQPTAAPPRATGADLRLVRLHRDVLVWCTAALVLPFVAYVVVLQVTGHLASRTALIFLFAPLITAGVLVGLALDIGHRRHAPDRGGPNGPSGPG